MPRFLFIGQNACRSSLMISMRHNFLQAEISRTGTLNEGLSHIQQDRVDLVLADLDLSGFHTVETLKSVCAVHTRVRFAIISYSDSRERIFSSLAAGLHGFILKHQPDEDIIAAIKQILAGRTYIPWPLIDSGEGAPAANGAEECRCHSTHQGGDALKLTPRQHQVLRLLSQGMSNKEIAHALRIAESTTKIHTAMLMRALGVRNRTEAAFKAGKLLGLTER